MEFVWNDQDTDIGAYECALLDDAAPLTY